MAVNEYVTVPDPVPLAPFVIDIHDTALDAVQLQLAVVVTVTVAEPPAPVTDGAVGETVKLHGTPACVTLNVMPAIVSVPLRDVVDVFAAALNVTAPLPVVFGPPPAVTVIQDALLVADHEQSVGMVTETTRVPPAAASESLVGDSEAVQGAAAWLIVNN